MQRFQGFEDAALRGRIEHSERDSRRDATSAHRDSVVAAMPLLRCLC